MKLRYLLSASLIFVSALHAEEFQWENLDRQRIDLKLPLLTIKGEQGILACGYINVSTCEKTGEACAIVSGVMDHEQMLLKPVLAVSSLAKALGVEPGMSGAQALAILR